jgi:hypothetical protein
MKLYCVSSHEFEDLESAEECLSEWAEKGILDGESRVYEIKRTYIPKIKVELEDERDIC